MKFILEQSWKKYLNSEFKKLYFTQLATYISAEYTKNKIYPPSNQIFRAFDSSPFEKTKAVIIGQDPYHGKGQANGLCFSVNDTIKIPPSLKNIFKEIEADIGRPIPKSGNLERWANQGILLLNTTLTVKESLPKSHKNKGWEDFTSAVINILNNEKEHLVFFLWGVCAKEKGVIIDKKKHLVLKSAHPSPFSAHHGFFGNKHFSRCNTYLKKYNKTIIQW